MTTWPCEKFIVRLVAHVMWYPRATRPYMLPSARPVTTSWTSKKLLGRDRDDLPGLPDHHDVVLVGESVVLLGGKRSFVGLDEALVLGLEVLERVANLGPVRATRLIDGQRQQMHAVVRVRRPDRRDDIFRSLHAVLVPKRLQHGLPPRVLLTEERVGLQEDHTVGQLARQFGKAAARDAPVGDHRRR